MLGFDRVERFELFGYMCYPRAGFLINRKTR